MSEENTNTKVKGCKACGKEIGKGVKKCVHCGADQRNFFGRHKILTGILAIFIFGGVISAMGSGSKSNATTVSPATSSTATPAPATATPVVASTPAPAPVPSVKTYKAGMYKVGTDMPAGEYTLMADGMAYFQVSKDSTGTMDSIISNDNFNNRSILTVSDGQYLTLRACVAYAFKDAPKIVPSTDGFLPEGMYKVGVDLVAGEYKVTSDSGMAYAEVTSKSSHDMGSIVSNDNFDGEKYITVKDGQYLKLTRAKLKLK